MNTANAFDLYDAVATAVFVLELEADGVPHYVAINRHGVEAIGKTRADYVGRTAKDVYPGRVGDTLTARQIEVFETGQPDTYEVELNFKGTARWVRTTLEPVFDDAGQVVRIVGTSNDITIEQLSDTLRTNLYTANTEIEQFISMAAHDLRTPMRNVQELAEMLRDGFEDHGDGKVELIDMLEDVALKSSELISDILSHAQTTNVQADVRNFDVSKLCQNMRDVLDPQGQHHFDMPVGQVFGDKAALQIVLRNLLDNSLKHGGKTPLNVAIRLSVHSDKMIKIDVIDDGRGFENPGNAFLDTGVFRVDSGFGLLGIRRLITARGGTIAARERGTTSGSIVTFTLPGLLMNADQATAHPPLMKASR